MPRRLEAYRLQRRGEQRTVLEAVAAAPCADELVLYRLEVEAHAPSEKHVAVRVGYRCHRRPVNFRGNPCQHRKYSAWSCADSSAWRVGRITQRVSNMKAIVSSM